MEFDLKYVYWVEPNQLAGRPGPDRAPWDPAELKAGGIGGIVSLCGPVDSTPLKAIGIKHLSVAQPMILLETEPMRERFLAVMKPAFRFSRECLENGEAVLVHCYHGCDRSGAVLACHLVAWRGLSAAEAVAQVRRANPAAMSAFGYAQAVATFERIYHASPAAFEPVQVPGS
jgi:hypothetical protein